MDVVALKETGDGGPERKEKGEIKNASKQQGGRKKERTFQMQIGQLVLPVSIRVGLSDFRLLLLSSYIVVHTQAI